MSVETITWAKEQRCGCPYAKAVLLELANWARPNGICEFRRVRDITAVIEVSERTVQRALKRLEDQPKKGGLGLIQRVMQHGADGGQRANRFNLIGYIYRSDCQSPSDDMQSLVGRPLVRGRSDMPVTPKKNQESKQKDSPQSPRTTNQPISLKWQAPPVQELPTSAKAMAGQWPPATYLSEAEAYHQYWNALWAARVQSQHERIMKTATAESQESTRKSKVSNSPKLIGPPPAALAQVHEDGRSASLRQALRERVGEQRWTGIFAPAAYIFDLPGLKVFVSTTACQQVIETQFAGMLKSAAQSVEPAITWVRIEAEPRQFGASR
jgi:Helix-turn-helix domain